MTLSSPQGHETSRVAQKRRLGHEMTQGCGKVMAGLASRIHGFLIYPPPVAVLPLARQEGAFLRRALGVGHDVHVKLRKKQRQKQEGRRVGISRMYSARRILELYWVVSMYGG
jgi:hypothetical protein